MKDVLLSNEDLVLLHSYISDPQNWELDSRGRMLCCPTDQFIRTNFVHLGSDKINDLIYLCTLGWSADRLPDSTTYLRICTARITAKQAAKTVNVSRKQIALRNTIAALEDKLERARSELRKIS